MAKDFDIWNVTKKTTDAAAERPSYHAREIWWCALGTNIGSEQDGTGKNFDRPVVVVRGFNREVCFVVALMGRKRTSPYHFPVGLVDDREASAILSQVRLLDTKRLVRKIRMLDANVFEDLTARLKNTLFPTSEEVKN